MSLFSRNRTAAHTRNRRQVRPRLDALEDRFLLNAGDLDTTFGNGGEVLTAFPPTLKGYRGTGGNAFDVKIQSDGKIVAVGEGLHDFVLARYNTDGSLDSTFGSGGKVETSFGPNQAGSAWGLTIQSDGKIIAVGHTVTTSAAVFAVARYLGAATTINGVAYKAGSLDPTFGPNHNGLVTTTILGNDLARSVVVQPDGKIVVAGDANSTATSSTSSDALVRYNSDGTLDTSFGQGGIINMTVVPGAGVNQAFGSVALETINVGGTPTTEIVASGPLPKKGTVLARFNLNGSLDPSFGSGGTVILQTVNPVVVVPSLAIQPDGKIVEAGVVTNAQGIYDAAVARFNIDGTLDTTSFNPNGPTPGVVDLGIPGLADRAALQPDGKIVVGGYANSQLMVARLNGADGSLDTTFGTNGISLKTLPGNPSAKGMALQSDGKIVTVGAASGGSDGYFAVARFLGDPPPPVLQTAASAASLMNAAPVPNPILVPLVLDDPVFLNTFVSAQRRHSTSSLS